MFGGICFLVDDRMCMDVVKNDLRVRIDSEQQEDYLSEKGCHPMDFNKRPMNGFLFISPEAVDMDEDLEKWTDRCLAFNPLAKLNQKSKRKNKNPNNQKTNKFQFLIEKMYHKYLFLEFCF